MPAHRRPQDKRQRLRQLGTLNPRPQAVSDPLFQDNEFFDANDLLQVKYEMVRLVRMENRSVTDSAKAFGFSRPSFYQAQGAFEQNGLAGLLPQKPGPRSGHKLTVPVMQFLTRARTNEPTLRAEQLAVLVKKNFGVKVHPRSIERQFRRQKKPR
jgi:transposase